MSEDAKKIGREIRELVDQIVGKMNEAKSRGVTVNFRLDTDPTGKRTVTAFECLVRIDLDNPSLN